MMDFKFADIGEGIHEGVILEWKTKIGQTIQEGDTLVIIETDKVNAEIPSPVTGTITKLGPDIGQTVHVGETLALIDDGSSASQEKSQVKTEAVTEGEEENAAGVVGTIEVSSEVIESSNESLVRNDSNQSKKVLATPVARKLAKDLGVDITTIKGSGENGRIMKEDIKQASQAQTSPQSPQKTVTASIPNYKEERITREKISRLRKTIAENMTVSKSVIPHTTVMDEVIVDELVTLRNSQKEIAKEKGYSLTFMPFIIKALTKSLEQHRVFNSSFDHNSDEIIYKNYMNIGVAVDTPDGLIVPNIKDANTLSILELSQQLQVLKEKAANKKITLDDLADGTISITNYGIFDSTFGAPVIKFPEVAIIGIGRISQKPVVENGDIVIKYVLPLSLSIDHRVIDGGDAGRFLKTLKGYLTNPLLLLMS